MIDDQRLTPGEAYALADLSCAIEVGNFHNVVSTTDRGQHPTITKVMAVVDAEGEIVCYAVMAKAMTLVKILNKMEQIIDRES